MFPRRVNIFHITCFAMFYCLNCISSSQLMFVKFCKMFSMMKLYLLSDTLQRERKVAASLQEHLDKFPRRGNLDYLKREIEALSSAWISCNEILIYSIFFHEINFTHVLFPLSIKFVCERS